MNSCETAPVRPGLRERKKLKTQHALQEHALRLFTEQGYDETTIEQIAEAAEVSPSTFFRYYPTKEDVLLRDEFDPIVVACLLGQPREKPPMRAVRDAIKAAFSGLDPEEEQQFLARYRIAITTPITRSRLYESFLEALDLFANTLAEWKGLTPHDPALRTLVGAVTGVIQQAAIEWVKSGGEKPFASVIDEHLARLEGGLKI